MAISRSLTIVNKSRKFIAEIGYKNIIELNHANDKTTTDRLLNSSVWTINHP